MPEQESAVIEWLDNPGLLIPNKYSVGIYGEDGFQDLLESVKALGILQPLYATTTGKIISGHRRWRAAQVARQQGKRVPIPVILKTYATELDEWQAIIEFNRYRIKTGQQIYNEGEALKGIEAERARKRQEASLPKEGQKGFQSNVVEIVPPHKTRDIIAQSVGLGSGRQWDKLEYVADTKWFNNHHGEYKYREHLEFVAEYMARNYHKKEGKQ